MEFMPVDSYPVSGHHWGRPASIFFDLLIRYLHQFTPILHKIHTVHIRKVIISSPWRHTGWALRSNSHHLCKAQGLWGGIRLKIQLLRYHFTNTIGIRFCSVGGRKNAISLMSWADRRGLLSLSNLLNARADRKRPTSPVFLFFQIYS